jgi:hypothetical protein
MFWIMKRIRERGGILGAFEELMQDAPSWFRHETLEVTSSFGNAAHRRTSFHMQQTFSLFSFSTSVREGLVGDLTR